MRGDGRVRIIRSPALAACGPAGWRRVRAGRPKRRFAHARIGAERESGCTGPGAPDAAEHGPAAGCRHGRPPHPLADLQSSARRRRRAALRVPPDVPLPAGAPQARGPRDLPRGDADDEAPAQRLSELQHTAGARAGNQVIGLGCLQHGLEPHARPGPVRRRRDDRRAEPRSARGFGSVARRPAPPDDPQRQGTTGGASLVHGAYERHSAAEAVVRQRRARRPDPRRSAPGAARGCAGRHRQRARRRRVRSCAERVPAQAGSGAAALAHDHGGGRPARPRRPADHARGGAARRLRRGQPHLQPVRGVLSRGDAGRTDRPSLRASYRRTVGVVGRSTSVRPVPFRVP